MPEDFAYEMPDAFGDVEAAPLLCAGIIGYRALQRSNLPPRRHAGALRLRLVGPRDHPDRPAPRLRGLRGHARREPPRAGPARWAPPGSARRPEDMPVKVDSAILFAPAGELVPPALEKLDKGGTLSLAGIYMTPIPPLDYERHLFYERDIRSVTANTRDDGRELLAEAAAIPIRPHTTIYPAGRRQPGPPGPEGRPDQRHGRAGDGLRYQFSYGEQDPQNQGHETRDPDGDADGVPQDIAHVLDTWPMMHDSRNNQRQAYQNLSVTICLLHFRPPRASPWGLVDFLVLQRLRPQASNGVIHCEDIQQAGEMTV